MFLLRAFLVRCAGIGRSSWAHEAESYRFMGNTVCRLRCLGVLELITYAYAEVVGMGMCRVSGHNTAFGIQ